MIRLRSTMLVGLAGLLALVGCQRQTDDDLRQAYDRMMAQAERRAAEEEARRPAPADPAAPATPGPAEPPGEPTETQPEPTAPTAEPPVAEPAPQPIAGTTVLRDVRIGEHAGFDRVVFEFDSPSLPSHQLDYVNPPIRECGTGSTVGIAGERWLRVRFEPVRAHEVVGGATQPTVAARNRTVQFGSLRQITQTCDAQGQVEWVLGVTAQHRYRVLELAEPTRLVLDLLDE